MADARVNRVHEALLKLKITRATQTSPNSLAKQFNSAFGQSTVVVDIVHALCEEITTARNLSITLGKPLRASDVSKVLVEIGSLHANNLNDLDKKESQLLLLECLIVEHATRRRGSDLLLKRLNKRLFSSDSRAFVIECTLPGIVLNSQVQIERMTSAQQQQSTQQVEREAAARNNLLRVLNVLKVDRNIAIDARSIFGAILAKTKEQLSKVPEQQRKQILTPALCGGTLNEKHWRLIEELNKELRDEYQMRAKLLLKRLNLTIQSFTWSDRVKKNEEQLLQVYRPRRDKLSPTSKVAVSDVLAARSDLCIVEKTSTGAARTKTSLNKIRIQGSMPDRGGRPDQIEAPPPEMPPWQKERAQGGGGFHGGHRGGDAGRGRRHSPRGGGGSGWSSGRRGGHNQPNDPYVSYQQQYSGPTQFGNPAYASATATMFAASGQQFNPQYQPQHQNGSYSNYQQGFGGGGRGRGRGRGRY